MSTGRAVDAASENSPEEAVLGRFVRRLVRSPFYRLARRLYHRHDKIAPPLLFFGGVTWDALTLQ